jgi:hypothetical protein
VVQTAPHEEAFLRNYYEPPTRYEPPDRFNGNLDQPSGWGPIADAIAYWKKEVRMEHQGERKTTERKGEGTRGETRIVAGKRVGTNFGRKTGVRMETGNFDLPGGGR